MTDLSDRAHIDAVLAERARLLAQPAAVPRTDRTVAVVAFAAAGERYAIETAHVTRLEPLERITPLPGAPPHFAGIANLHGQIVPLIDLGVLLGAAPCAQPTYAIALGGARTELGILADELLDLRALSWDEPGAPAPAPRPIVRHITTDGTAVIDGAALLADPRLVAGERAADAPPEETLR